MEIKSLPEHLQSIAEKVIAHIYGGSSIPEGIDELTDWFEDEGWDELVGAWSDEHIALKLQYLAESKFNDSELVGCEVDTANPTIWSNCPSPVLYGIHRKGSRVDI
jgi:hypothetical protein